jgi:hypothetical protein
MTEKFSIKYILTFCLIITTALLAKAQKVKPLLHLAIGQTYYLESNGTSSTLQNVNGTQKKVNIGLSFKMAFKITGVKDTVYQMEARYQSLDMKIKLPDTAIDINSEKAGKLDTPSAIVAKMMNRPFNISLSNTGRVSQVDHMDNIIAGAFDEFPQMDASKKEQIKSLFLRSFGETAFTGCLETGLAIFPHYPVAKNDKWAVSSHILSPAPAGVHIVYQLVDMSGDFYHIHGEGTLTSDTTTNTVGANSQPVKYEMEGSTQADIKIDKKTGWVVEVKLKQLMTGNVDLPGRPEIPDGLKLPMLFTTEITTTGK